MKEDIRPQYLKACEEVCEKFGREEKLDHLKNEVNLGTFPEIARDLDEEITDFCREIPLKHKIILSPFFVLMAADRFKTVNKIKKSNSPYYHKGKIKFEYNHYNKEKKYEFIGYPENFDSEKAYSILLHEVGHALFYSYRESFPGSGISEAYALASQGRSKAKITQRIGEELLKGKKLSKAIERGIETSIENEELITKGSKRPKREECKDWKIFIDMIWGDSKEYHFKGAALFNKIREEYNKNSQKVMGDALANPDIDFDDPNKFYRDLVNNY